MFFNMINSRLLNIQVLIDECMANILSDYPPQTDSTVEKNIFSMIYCLSKVALILENEIPLVWGDSNWHLERYANGFENVHGNQGFGTRNVEGFSFLDLCTAVNTYFKTQDIYFLLSSQNFHILFLYLSLEVIVELEVNSLKTTYH